MITRSGVLTDLAISGGITPEGEGAAGADADYVLCFDRDEALPLNGLLGRGMTVTFSGAIVCRYCAAEGRRSFGGGYCYECFRSLARCDLCVVSPDRCHYAQGTCREPAWGEAFCMQPHRVYLANSSGIKVGITREGREVGRWLDQGAIQGLVILDADSRRAAGLAEVSIARRLPDRTDWRKMLRADVPALDLGAERDRIRESALPLPAGVRWSDDRTVVRLRYPLSGIEPPADTLKLTAGAVRGNLLGMKGQYLVLSCGALNVGAHLGYRVTVQVGEPFERSGSGTDQLGLF
ncbi:MAG: DUF2797 domain-containing protein [Pseudomonadales bacterium]